MNRVVLKHVVIFALVACAAATVLLLMPSGRNVRLRSELAECERAVSMRNDCLVVVKQLSVDAEKVDLQAGSDKSNIR